MPEKHDIVINTGPLIALVAATGSLRILKSLYARVVVPFEVTREILAGDAGRFAAAEFNASSWIEKKEGPIALGPSLMSTLGVGEAAVIQCALTEKIRLVAIDEAVGRRIARLSGLAVTGSLGILIRARREGFSINMNEAIGSMRRKGIWLSDTLAARALKQAGE